MKWLLFIVLIQGSVALGFDRLESGGDLYYVGVKSGEALVEFEHWVEIEASRTPSTNSLQYQVEQQLTHLFGPLSADEFPAVPKTDHQFKITDVRKVNNSTYKVSYIYKGHFVIRFGVDHQMDLALPNNPDKIYEAGLVGVKNPCTDDHYQSEGDFWYFWNPSQPGCPLKEGRDYSIVSARVLRLPNTSKTYPEYERLKDSQGRISVSIFFGMDAPKPKPDPYRSNDINASNYLRTQKSLAALGFKSIMRAPGAIYFEEHFEKKYSSNRSGVKSLLIKAYFGPTGISEDSEGFHRLLQQSLEGDALMIYDGHSGLGGHLDLESIEMSLRDKIKMPLERYQILFFNSCSSYPYYNTQYFARKITDQDQRGSKNLDILTNGLATYFHTIANSNFAMFQALDEYASTGAKKTYQELALAIDSGNLFGVNGDEDNPTQP